MNDEFLPQYDPPPLEPPDWVYCFWEVAIPVFIVIFVIVVIVLKIH